MATQTQTTVQHVNADDAGSLCNRAILAFVLSHPVCLDVPAVLCCVRVCHTAAAVLQVLHSSHEGTWHAGGLLRCM